MTAKTAKKASKPKKPRAAKAEAAAPTIDPVTGEPVEAAPRKTRKAAQPADPRVVVMHGETRIVHMGEADAAAAVSGLGRLIDQVHALERVRITSVAHVAGVSTLHAVLPDHPQPYDLNPGIVIAIASDGEVRFDDATLGRVSPELVDDAAASILGAVRPDDGSAGRRSDWLAAAMAAAEDASLRHAA